MGRRLQRQERVGIKPVSENMEASLRDAEEGRSFYEVLQDQVIPLYYSHGKSGYSVEWVNMAKHSMASLLPQYGTRRMVGEYIQKFYTLASQQGAGYSQDNFAVAKAVADWKARINAAWEGVSIRRLDTPGKHLEFGSALHFKLAVKLNGLQPEDVVVELLLSREYNKTRLSQFQHTRLECTGTIGTNEHQFELSHIPELCGRQQYYLRIYPYHPLLTHPLEMGKMLWL